MGWNPFKKVNDGVDNIIAQKVLGSVVRHLLTVLGGYLVTKGYVDQAGWDEAAAGAAVFIVSLVWSVYQKHSTEQTIATALDMPRGTTRATLEKVKDA